jgi:dethiobiotin synthetase
MQVFITGTDTDIGKTLVSSWLCLHTGYDYFKPIQTGPVNDSKTVASLTNNKIYKEAYIYPDPVSPHLASSIQNEIIEISKISLPASQNLIIEGAGGLLVPLNHSSFMIDLIKQMNIPTILVSSSKLGTINHTLLSLEALKNRNIPVLGVIVNGNDNLHNIKAIEFYSNVPILAHIPTLPTINKECLLEIPFNQNLKKIFKV